MKKLNFIFILVFVLTGLSRGLIHDAYPLNTRDKNSVPNSFSDNLPGIRKVKDLIIYKDSLFYSTFPSVVKRPDGEVLVAFRRAPNRILFGADGVSHTDPNSYLVMVRSRDGETWSKEPELIFAHPFGGSQDPCLLQLKDGTLICTSYVWGLIRSDADSILKRKVTRAVRKSDHIPSFTFMGGYLVRSTDGGHKWQGPIYPSHVPGDDQLNVWGNPLPAYNRGALCEGSNGLIYWVVAAKVPALSSNTSTHLLVSEDKGLTWKYACTVASNEKISFNETSIYETPKGDLVAFLRTTKSPDNYSCIARSTDKGKSFKWQSIGFFGYPLHALKLPDNRVLLTYGYRQKPNGIRARILNPECTDFASAPEFVIRDDGGSTDLGYSWSVLLDNNRVLVVYYFNKDNGIRYIAGTILEINKK